MLNRGYAYTTIISSKYHGQTLLSHLANLYPLVSAFELACAGSSIDGARLIVEDVPIVVYRPACQGRPPASQIQAEDQLPGGGWHFHDPRRAEPWLWR